ncbi:MAG: hypothetical protein WDN69_30990 [Aliidongia sp.]
MDLLALAVTRRYVTYTAAIAATLVFLILSLIEPVFLWPCLVAAILVAIGTYDLLQTPPQHQPQLPDRRPYPLPARRHPAGDPPVLPGERHRRHAVQTAQSGRWSISAPRASSTSGPSAPSSTSTPRSSSG